MGTDGVNGDGCTCSLYIPHQQGELLGRYRHSVESLLSLVNDEPIEYCLEYIGAIDVIYWCLEEIPVKHDKVGILAGFDGTDVIFSQRS